MSTIQIFDPALCCSTGVCGVDVDQQLVDFSADLDWAKQNGAQIERFNLAQQSMAFAENPVVKAFLETYGAEALPVVLVDGALTLAGRYPTRDELLQWAGLNSAVSKPLNQQIEELIALGAAIAAGCEPCFKFHYDKARKLGVSNQAMQQAVEIGDMVKRASAKNMLELAGRILDKPAASACCGNTPDEKPAATACCGSAPDEKPVESGGCCG
ncbi:MAG: arsenite efflux transporter metallochaperone ArsD [Methylomonas sp.]|nr:arsenite efflux transporter metallochaperone ArsD [Methylomonas sp.]